MNYDWIKDIPNFKEFFTTDLQDQIELIGFDEYMKLHLRFEKTSVFYSSAPITMLKKAWAIKNRQIPYNEAARILGVSEKTIYNWRQDNNLDNYNLFEKDNRQ